MPEIELTANTSLVSRVIVDEMIANYKEEIMKRNTRIQFLESEVDRLEQMEVVAEEVAKALANAAERGDYLHIGIVLGQSIQRLYSIIQ